MKNFQKIISIALTALMLCTLCITASAASLTGNGTEANPYKITNAADLDALAELVNSGNSLEGKYILLTQDVIVSEAFSPIGSKSNPFSGNFNGNGNTLDGIYVDCDYAGVFGYIDNAVITDLTVSGDFNAVDYAGAVAAYAVDSTITDCISISSVYADNYAGGIVGYIASGAVTDCIADTYAAIGGYEDSTGGIAGYSAADISGCENDSYTKGAKNVGGIVGTSKGTVTNCKNTGAVYSTSSGLGGIVGFSEGNISLCKNTGAINPSGSNIGNTAGIVGVAKNCSVTECMSVANISATGNFIGGIAGNTTDVTIKNCVAAGTISNTKSYAGGIFGFALRGTVSECVSAASVTASGATDGGIGGVCQATVSNCYYSSAETKAVNVGSASAEALSASNFTNAASFSALDFEKIWVINEVHAEYPILKNIPYHTLINVSSAEANCDTDGFYKADCKVCLEKIRITYPATGHDYKVLSSKTATCTVDGYEDLFCNICSGTSTIEYPAAGHKDADSNKRCDVCNVKLNDDGTENTEKTFFEKIADFFNSILEWIRNLFR